jgi:sporulation protein YlmC with PRC-barrel domain
MIRASDLVGCIVQDESGRRLGRVHDLRAEADERGWCLVALVTGRLGLLTRLVGTGESPLIGGDLVPWERVVGLDDGLITVRNTDGSAVGTESG